MIQTSSHAPRASRLLSAVLGAVVLLLPGCNVGPKYRPPAMPTPPAFREASSQEAADGTIWSPASPNDAAIRGTWWEIYNEPELDLLENRLNSSNQNIAQSYETFMAARALVRQARSSFSPTLTTSPAYTRGRTSANQSGQQFPGLNPNSNEFSLPFDFSWQPDLWGRVGNTVRQNVNAAQVSAADLANVKLSEQANLAITYFELRGQDSLIEVYEQTIEAYQKSLDLTQTLHSIGIQNQQAVAQAELNLNGAKATVTNLRIARAEYEHAIALLIGESASTFTLPARGLATPAPQIPVGVPSDLLQRRPDIAAAERTMSQANAAIGVQMAAFYPNISITGEAGLQSSKVSDWFLWPSRFFSIGPTATETIFDAGARKSALANLTARYEADVAAYRQTVLTAMQQVEDALASQRLLSIQMKQQQDVIENAQKNYDLANLLYRNGVDSHLDVFVADTALLSQKQTAVLLRVQQMSSNVQLIEAIGGGWNTSQLPSASDVAAKH